METDLTFERNFWGSCANTFEEEKKHFVYARLMGLEWGGSGQTLDGYGWDVGDKRILDIGGGPVSMLLKTRNLKGGAVVDPLANQFPHWAEKRYEDNRIRLYNMSGEQIPSWHPYYDEVWIYNVLQHTDDPAKVIANAKAAAPVLRIFEWLDIPAYEGHPQMLTADKLKEWISLPGFSQVQHLNESGCYGKAFGGVFHRAS